jgi:beta-glucanase (GH16 family)
MRNLQFSALLGLSWLAAVACSSAPTSPQRFSPVAGSAGALGVAGAPVSVAGSVGSVDLGGAGSAQAGSPAGGEVSTGGAEPAPSSAGSAGSAGSPGSAGTVGVADPLAGWTLTWSDEFDGDAGKQADSTKWKYTNAASNVNNELEYYSNRPENSALDGMGHLLIIARKEAFNGRNYTSAKMSTQGLFSQKYGRFETRVQLPAGKGLWPAFWTLGNNNVGWPQCGEMDIMETIGTQLTINRGSLHGPGYSGDNPLTAQFHLMGGSDLSQDFHTYAVEWAENVVRFYVDDMLYETRTPQDIPGKQWVYDHDFYVLYNLAVGGAFPGSPDDSIFPRTMTIDYVRVYSPSTAGTTITPTN